MTRIDFLRVSGFLIAGSLIAGIAQAEDAKPPVIELQAAGITIQFGEGAVGFASSTAFQSTESMGKWLGLAVEPNDGGVKIQKVFPGSPAEKSGLKPNDIVIESGVTPIKEPADLQKLVGSAGTSFPLTVLREEKKVEIEVTRMQAGTGQTENPKDPTANVKRPPQVFYVNPKDGKRRMPNVPTARNWVQLKQQLVPVAVPEDLQITIKKKGDGPIRIKVQQGVQSWNISEKELDKLPVAIRGHVAKMLPGSAHVTTKATSEKKPQLMFYQGFATQSNASNDVPAYRKPSGVIMIESKQAAETGTVEKLEQEVKQLKQQLQKLQDQVNSLNKAESLE